MSPLARLYSLLLLTFSLAACASNRGFPTEDAQPQDTSAAQDASSMDAPALDAPSRDALAPRDASSEALDDAASSDASSSDGPVDCGTPLTMVPYADQNTDAEFTDPPTCARCPGSFLGLDALNRPLPPSATTLQLDGSSAGATACEWYVLGGSCGVTHGSLATDPDGTGLFTATVPVFCGVNTVRIVCHNAAGSRVYVRNVRGTECMGTGRDLRVTLTWDNNGTDMELHLVRQGGHLNQDPDDCTWFTCISRMPMWGPLPGNIPHKDVDNTSYLGPENIYLDAAPAGTYSILVEYWGSGAPSTNNVDVTIRERTVAHLTRPALAVHSVWFVGRVSFPSGVFTPADTVTDCASSWRASTMGCDLPLP